MNPRLVVLLVLMAIAGPLSDLWWVEWAEQALDGASIGPPFVEAGGLRLEMARSRSDLSWRSSGSFTVRAGQAAIRLAGTGRRSGSPGGSSDASVALTATSRRYAMGCGRLRGGLGSGLMVLLSDPWGNPGVWAMPQTGRPVGLRAHPGPMPATGVAGVYLSEGGSRWTLAGLGGEEVGSTGILSVAASAGTGAVVMAGAGGTGLEMTGSLIWPGADLGIAAAGWSAGGRKGGAVELRFATGAGDRFGIRAWRVWGPHSPLAPWLRGAGERWRSGLAIGMKLRPAKGWLVLSELERRFGTGGASGAGRWERRFDVRRSGADRLSARLRVIQRGEEAYRAWGGRDLWRVSRHVLSVGLPPTAGGAVSAGLQHASEKRGSGTWGAWLQFEGRCGPYPVTARVVRVFGADGSAAWWYEPTPPGTWGVRADRRRTTRFVLDTEGPERRWFLRLILERTTDPELLFVWRSG